MPISTMTVASNEENTCVQVSSSVGNSDYDVLELEVVDFYFAKNYHSD